jgi:hypothetical protein
MNKFEWTSGTGFPKAIKLEDLICKDCKHRSPRTDICAEYQDIKPIKIFDGGNCELYEKDK